MNLEEVTSAVHDLFGQAVEEGTLAKNSTSSDADEVFQDMCEMYLGEDLSKEELILARESFDAAFGKLQASTAD